MKKEKCDYCGKRTKYMYSCGWANFDGIFHRNMACEKHKREALLKQELELLKDERNQILQQENKLKI